MNAPARLSWPQRVRAWLRPPRRLRLLRPGGLLIAGIFGLGFATLNTGNNLLYLLLGALLGLIALSGWLSEQTLRKLRITRVLPAAATAGEATSLLYVIRNRKRVLPSFLLTIREHVPDAERTDAFVVSVPARGDVSARARVTFPVRGEYPLDEIVLSTTFPYGLFRKERDIVLPGTVLVRPRTTRPVRALRPAGRAGVRARTPLAAAAAGAERGEFRGLRPYRSGDDPRDVHWRSTARTGEPIVREYDREQGRSYWLCLATAHAGGPAAEVAVEIAAALAAAAVARNDQFGFSGGGYVVSQGSGPAQLDRVLDALARVRFATPMRLPAARADCVWITSTGAAEPGFADVFIAGSAA